MLERKWLTTNDISSNTLVSMKANGNINYLFSYAGMNRSANHTQTVSVPWSNKGFDHRIWHI
ncbi:MAG: hypothetical protein R2825_07770 [Saprospiraceae bacterium]